MPGRGVKCFSHAALVFQVPHPAQRRAYKLKSWSDAEDFLTQLGRASGKLVRGGDADLNTTARMVLLDWQRGRLPFYSLPPDYTDLPPGAERAEGPGGEGPQVGRALCAWC